MHRKQKFAYFFSGLLCAALVASMVSPTFAALVQKTIKVFTGVNIYIDDQKLDIRLALMRLPIQQRNLIILRYVREHTQKETAKIMGVSQSQISRIERQALNALRKWLI